MNTKTLSIVSYITLIGWLVAYFAGRGHADPLVKYHLRQSLGLLITGFLFNLMIMILVIIVPGLAFLSYAGYLFLALMVFGVINASNEVQRPLPVIGSFFEGKFSFIG